MIFLCNHHIFFSKNRETFIKLKTLINNASKLKIKYLVLPLVDNGSIKNKHHENKFIKMTLELKKILKKKIICL